MTDPGAFGASGSVDCPDGHRCDNGSKCVENPIDEGSYYCDCDVSQLEDAIAGVSCEAKATEYCTFSQEISHVSFCTNGGTCKADIGSDGVHLGCDCPDIFEGQHCEFVKGTEPELTPQSNGLGSGGLSGGGTAGVILLVLVVGGALA